MSPAPDSGQKERAPPSEPHKASTTGSGKASVGIKRRPSAFDAPQVSAEKRLKLASPAGPTTAQRLSSTASGILEAKKNQKPVFGHLDVVMSDDPDGIEIRNNTTKSAVVDVISDHTFACSGPCAQVDAMIAKMMKLIDCDLELTFSAVVKIGYKDDTTSSSTSAPNNDLFNETFDERLKSGLL
ncbi:hypothetical protein CTRI78_v006159 [Colletotrichum trifolii]|uniref:Uncharacterized protein n=1 Tax=Colletotrichum trifolii TaxID=5466 RepID=A0A4R8RD15_COLTR|nr:hypothetical protein CTRI78_v006159 [Colletotrichum trifolii]